MLAPILSVTASDPPPAPPCDILNGPLKEKFKRITRLAKGLFDVPIAAVHFLNGQRTQFTSLIGTQVVETSHEISAFYGHPLSQEGILNIPETFLDERFRNNPYVLGGHHVRFYASCPFHLNHQKLGTVSISDDKPRYFSQDQLVLLTDIAGLIETEIQNYAITTDKGRLTSDLNQARMASMIDPLTSLWNRQGMYNILKHRMDEYLLNGTRFGLAILDIDKFKEINDTYGHDTGDQVLITIANSLIGGCRDTDAIGRWGGEEFLMLINEQSLHHIIDIAERVRTIVESQDIPLSSIASIKITATIGLTSILSGSYPTVEEMINKADQALYQGKRNGRNRTFSL